MSSRLPRGLRYVDDAMPGFARVRCGSGFAYRDCDGRRLRDPRTLDRIRRLAIPPAYDHVWICPVPNGHLQATGRDARGRKQYRYHADFRAVREAYKFDRLVPFGAVLPRLRARVAADLARGHGQAAPTREAVLATIVRLLDTTYVRVGNDSYARENGSFGLTTLRRRHVAVEGSMLRLSFRGKSGRRHDVAMDDTRVVRVVRRCQQLPGQDLFQFVDADGMARTVGSADVNDYLEQASGGRFTAKDFRTWHASVLALELLRKDATHEDAFAQRSRIAAVVAEVARRLGNTPAICRKSYIHPDVLAAAQRGDTPRTAASALGARSGLLAAELRLLHLLGERAGACGQPAGLVK